VTPTVVTPEATKRVQLTRALSIAKFVALDKHHRQQTTSHKAGDLVEVPLSMAYGLVRAKRAKFASKEDQQQFDDSEDRRIASGDFTDKEIKANCRAEKDAADKELEAAATGKK
jgi:hypothetical protein